ncbi:hypothetical protein SAMN04487825_109103 [Prevotella sp. kh1p2]|nr:hypothetical protein SAMN04487825_109103 [Prevotella sp. kh1p2]SNU11347.1 hypothetical protein SAMN06298210_109102 [Prevotellaceae bacterium KH2P17]
MRKGMRTVFCASLCVLMLATASCGNGQKKEFNRLLTELAADDATIDSDDWSKIAGFLDSNKARLKEFYDGDRINVDAVKEYIEDFFEGRRPAREIKFVGIGGKPLKVKFYLERSGSMTAYDSPAGDGSFKAAIVQMLNNLPDNDNRIYVVNSNVNAYPQGFRKFLSDPNIFEATKGIGDPSYTDFGAIFDNILNKTGDDEISILVTDMIYSTRNMAGVNPQKVFAEAQGMTNAVFKSEVRNKSMLIIKMNGSFNGPYYAYNNSVRQYNGRRPYYIVVVGSNDNIARLTTDKSYIPFARFADLRGYEDMYLFETDDVYEPYYSILLNNPDIRGRFQPERGQSTQITDIDNVEVDRNSGDIRLALAVNLDGMLIDEDYLTDAANYEVESDDKITIREIRKISDKDVTPAEKKYLDKATHIFILEMKEMKNDQEVRIKLMNRLPAWVEASSNDDDTSVDARTTFGLKYLLQGIYNSYRKNSEGEPYYFELKMKFKD